MSIHRNGKSSSDLSSSACSQRPCCLAILCLLLYPFGMLAGAYFFLWFYRKSGSRPRVFARMQVILVGRCKLSLHVERAWNSLATRIS